MRRKSIVTGLLVSLLLLFGGGQTLAETTVAEEFLAAKQSTVKIGSQLAAIASGQANTALPGMTNAA